MSKRNNITYIKPADPKFLQQLKEQIGYNTGQETIESKRQRFDNDFDSGSDYEGDEEAPQVVVLTKGDLTAEEVDQEKQRIEKEENEKPADLSQRIVFKSTKSGSSSDTKPSDTDTKPSNKDTKPSDKDTKKLPKSQPKVNKSKLSFQDDDDDDDDDDDED